MEFSSNTGPDPLKNTKLPVGSSSARQRNAIDDDDDDDDNDDPCIMDFGSSLPSSIEKKSQKWTHSDKTFSIHAYRQLIKMKEFNNNYYRMGLGLFYRPASIVSG